jgi:hypothetical protein
VGRIGPVVTVLPVRARGARRAASVAVLVAGCAAAAALVAGCAAAPEVVAGSPAPLTPVPASGTSTPATARTRASPPGPAATSPTGPPSSPAATRPAPVLPAAYEAFQLTGQGVTVRLPVPTGWTRRRTELGYDFGDPSGTLLLRVNLTAREPGRTVRESWQALEAGQRLAGYRRLAARDVPGLFDGALDWTFVFDGNGGQRQVVDRLLLSGPAQIAVYFSAVGGDFGRLLPIWNTAVEGLEIS